jgi:hypothetical protein
MKTTYSRRELYAAGEFLGDSATQNKLGGGRIYGMGGGGGGQSSGPTQTTVQNTNIPDYARPYVETMLGATQQQLFNTQQNPDGTTQITGVKPFVPYSTNPQDYVAGFSPMQEQSFSGAANLGLPSEYNAAAGLTGAGIMGSMGAGANYNRMATDPNAVGSFMNPYVQQALQPQLNQLAQQGNLQAQQAAGQATAAGAFGGTRGALAQNLAQQNALMGQQAALGQGYNQAYNQAQQAMQYGAGLGLQGYGQALQGANQLANIGTQKLQGQQGILNLQNQYGQQQQQQQQNVVNNAINNYAMAQQYPQQQLAFMNSMLRGLPLQTGTTQMYQAAPSPISQVAGLGMAGYGLGKVAGMFKEGGSVKEKKYATGGITSIDKKVLNDPLAFSAQQISQGIKNKSVTPMIGAIALDQIENAPKTTPQMPQGTVLGELETKAQPQGIPNIPSNLPVRAAQGGIIAFSGEDGSLVEDDDEAMGGMSREERAMFDKYLANLTEPESQGIGINMTAPTGTGIRPEAKAPSGIETLSDRERLHKHVLHKESGGRRYDEKGRILTSSKGAEGEMQVMPFTQKDPGFGVTPARDNSAEEKARVGRDYLDAMYREFGDPKLAAIAYNMGPKATKEWLASGKGIDALPGETRKYIVGLAKGGKVMHFVNEGLVPGFEDLSGGEPYPEEKLPRSGKIGTKDVLNRAANRPSIEDLLKKDPMSTTSQATRTAERAVTRPTVGTFAVPAAVGYGGYKASELGANILRNPEAQKALGGKNIMQGALSGDTALPAEIQAQADKSKPIASWIPDWMLPSDLVQQRKVEQSKAPAAAPAAPAPQPEMGPPRSAMLSDKELNPPTPAAPESEKPKTAEENLSDYLKEIRENIASQREQDKNMALIAAGLGIAGGTSQHALTNIGQGGLKGVEAAMASQKQQSDAEKTLMGGYSALARANLYADARKEANLLGQQKVLAGQIQNKEKEAQAFVLNKMGIIDPAMLNQPDKAAAFQKQFNALLAQDKEYNAIKRKLYEMQGIDTAGKDWTGWSGSKANG